jgi:hypothetical protein
MQTSGLFPIFAISIVLTFEAAAQDLLPLEQLLKRPKDQIEASYPFVRCAAYYKSTVEYIGPQNLSKEVVENSHMAISLNAFAAARIRSSTRGGTANDYVDQVVGDVNQIVSAYHARMRRNYAASGQAFGDDALITGDANICKSLTETLARK